MQLPSFEEIRQLQSPYGNPRRENQGSQQEEKSQPSANANFESFLEQLLDAKLNKILPVTSQNQLPQPTPMYTMTQPASQFLNHPMYQQQATQQIHHFQRPVVDQYLVPQ